MEKEATKRGNPSFKKKDADKPKIFRYILTQEHNSLKPVNNKTGISDDNPYPPVYFLSNTGIALDPKTNQPRRWRYLYGYSSVWVDEQTNPKPTQQELVNPNHDIVFRQGFLKVSSTNTSLIRALELMDEFEGNNNKINQVPPVFRLIDPESELEKQYSALEASYEAGKAAREAKLMEMLPVAAVFGIDISGGEDDEPAIRKKFILKASEEPQRFLREFVNPKNKIRFLVSKALMENTVSSSVIEGKLVYADSHKIIADINPNGDIADQLAQLVMARNEKAMDFYEQLKLTVA